MIDPAVAETLRAAAEVFVPGSTTDPTIGAEDIEAERFLEHYLEYLAPGLSAGVAEALNASARDRFGKNLATLSLEERARVLDAVADHEVPQLREIPSVLGVLSIAAVYGEWTGLNEDGAVVRRPVGWAMSGFDGPSRGRPPLLRRR